MEFNRNAFYVSNILVFEVKISKIFGTVKHCLLVLDFAFFMHKKNCMAKFSFWFFLLLFDVWQMLINSAYEGWTFQVRITYMLSLIIHFDKFSKIPFHNSHVQKFSKTL